jgi:hypothetical protein
MRPTFFPSANRQHQNMPQISLHPLLQYSHRDTMGHHCCPILWDLRDPPASSVRLAKNKKSIATSRLSQYATTPPVSYLAVTCEVFPFPWRIEAQNPRGVTILDLLEAIYRVAHGGVRQYEWDGLSDKQQDRIAFIFEERWQGSRDPWRVRAGGVSRADCLLHSTSFAGLSMSCEKGYLSILTLSRSR